MKIGILTYHRAHNYGAYLQACSLVQRLNREGDFEAEIIDFNMPCEEKFYNKVSSWSLPEKARHFRTYRFLSTKSKAFKRGLSDDIMIKSKDRLCSDDLESFQKFVRGKYDVIIAGSDEIWRTKTIRGFPNAYWLCGDLGARKFSYAASSREDFSSFDDNKKKQICDLISEFELVSVRDKITYDAFRSVFTGLPEMTINCDPSFLSSFELPDSNIHDVLKGKAKLDINKKSVIVMLDNREAARNIYTQLADYYNLICVYNSYPGFVSVADLTPKEWLMCIDSADFVISSFFHGCCFSIVRNTPFIALDTPGKTSKLSFLLEGSVLDGRYVKYDPAIRFKELIENNLNTNNFQTFVDKQKKPFERFLDRLRNGDKQN